MFTFRSYSMFSDIGHWGIDIPQQMWILEIILLNMLPQYMWKHILALNSQNVFKTLICLYLKVLVHPLILGIKLFDTSLYVAVSIFKCVRHIAKYVLTYFVSKFPEYAAKKLKM